MSTDTLSTTDVPFPSLTAADRSDAHASGSVQALVRVVSEKTGLDLLLDKHSFDKSQASLIAQGFVVVQDVRDAVLNPPKTDNDRDY